MVLSILRVQKSIGHIVRTAAFLLGMAVPSFCADVQILTPADGARPDSAYIALEGLADSRDSVVIAVDGLKRGETHAEAAADSSGRWEAVVYLSAGEHVVTATSAQRSAAGESP